MKTSTTLPGDGIAISTYGNAKMFVALRYRRIGILVELVAELNIGWDIEEIDRAITTDEDEAVDMASDLERAALDHLKIYDAGADLYYDDLPFAESVERTLNASHIVRHLEAAVAAE